MNYNQLGEYIKQLRNEKGLTQAQLAERAKVNQSEISKMENGDFNVSIHTLGRVLNTLGETATIVVANEGKELLRLSLA